MITTGFMFQRPDESGGSKGLQFEQTVEELDAASAATEGPKRSVRTRIVTGFAKESDAQIMRIKGQIYQNYSVLFKIHV